jgi:hypothetical protein
MAIAVSLAELPLAAVAVGLVLVAVWVVRMQCRARFPGGMRDALLVLTGAHRGGAEGVGCIRWLRAPVCACAGHLQGLRTVIITDDLEGAKRVLLTAGADKVA